MPVFVEVLPFHQFNVDTSKHSDYGTAACMYIVGYLAVHFLLKVGVSVANFCSTPPFNQSKQIQQNRAKSYKL